MYIEGINPTLVYAVASASPEIPGPPFAVGTRGLDSQGKEYVFCSNTTTAALVIGDVLTLSIAYAASQLTTANDARGNYVGVPVVAVPASTSAIVQYFWAQRYGICAAVKVLASAVANVRLNTTATVGALDDDGTVGSMQVQGVYITTTNGGATATAPAILQYPFIDVTL